MRYDSFLVDKPIPLSSSLLLFFFYKTLKQITMEIYPDTYSSDLLQVIPRAEHRNRFSFSGDGLFFSGADVWYAYEFSWLNEKGKPEVAVIRFQIPANSARFIESKSFKMYLGSFSGTRFQERGVVQEILCKDLSDKVEASVVVDFPSANDLIPPNLSKRAGVNLDDLDIDIKEYQPNPGLLRANSDNEISEILFTDLFRSLCPITAQPDFASIIVDYTGGSIEHGSLLKYLVSFRKHADFSEHIVERIYVDLIENCTLSGLAVTARYTRRGGLDINPYRILNKEPPPDQRLIRQ